MQTMVGKGTLVADIIKTREPLVQRIEEQSANLFKLGQALRNLANLQAQVLSGVNVERAERIKEINLAPLQDGIQRELVTLDRLRTRFKRPTLNVGVIGHARQGKSRLLQSMSGLKDQEIPTGDLGACTGVRSTIMHSSEDSYAEVFFYSETDFLHLILAPYYEALQLGPVPDSIEQFALKPLPALSDQLKGNETDKARYNRLESYKAHIGAYRGLIDHASERLDDLRQVREYVAKLTEDGKDLHNHLAVREVQIHCPFPHAQDVEQVAFIDMPGLGDTVMGDETRLIEAVGRDIDIALVVRKPDTLGNLREALSNLSFYDIAQKPLKGLLPFRQWAFLILNRTKGSVGDNERNCLDLQVFLNRNPDKAFVDSMIVDCSEPDEVSAHILDPVLHYLLQNIRQLDEQFVRASQDGLLRLQTEAAGELSKALNIFDKEGINDDDQQHFQKHFEDTWTELMNGLVDLLKALEQKSDTPDEDFSSYFKGRLHACQDDPGIPSIETIKKRSAVKDGSYDIVYLEALSEMRAHLTYNFMDLDDALEKSMRNVKRDVASAFLQQGLLSVLPDLNEETFFEQMMQHTRRARLRHVFQVFHEYKLSYRGFFQQRIRQHLRHLKPADPPVKLSVQPDADDDARAQAVVDALAQAHAATLQDVQNELLGYLKEPNMAAFAIVEEFVDQAMRARGAENEWISFYYPRRMQIWETSYKDLVKWQHWQRNWEALASSALEANARILGR